MTENNLMTTEQIRHKLRDRKLSYIAKECDLTYMTLSRLLKGHSPSLKTVERLSDYFSDNE